MKPLFHLLASAFFLLSVPLHAQDIEAKLSGSSPAQGFTVKSQAGASLLTVRGDGKVGIGTSSPTGGFHITHNDGFLATGLYGYGSIPATGAGTRMMFYPKKSAFRVGAVQSDNWDDGNIGEFSFACGYNAMAKGNVSIAMGNSTIASGASTTAMGFASSATGDGSTALGNSTSAFGPASTAMGCGTTASNECATSMGANTSATGISSTAMGNYTTAGSFASVALGRYNVGGGSPLNWTSTDPLFEIGIGSSPSSKANAMTVLKNGNVGIGTYSPNYTLECNGSAGKPGGGSWTNSSDIRLKNLDGPYTRGLEEILRLRSYRFHYKPDNPRRLPSVSGEIGFIAQEIRDVFPESVTEGPDGYLDFNMHAINVALVNSVRELHAKLETERERREALEDQVAALRRELTSIRAELAGATSRDGGRQYTLKND